MYHTLTRKPKSVAEFTFSIPWEHLEPHIDREAGNLGKEMKVDGFRPGKVPASVVRQSLDDIDIVKQSVDRIIARLYSEAIAEEELQTLGKPNVSIEKLEESNPLEFVVSTSLVPSVALPEYQTFSVESKPVSISEEDVMKSLEELRKMRATKTESTESKTENREEGRPKSESEEPNTNKDEVTLPELNDEFAKSLGQFENLEALKTALKTNLEGERKYEEDVRLENAIVELLIQKSEFEELPDVLLESELENVFHEFKHNIEHHGVSFTSWLEQTKKTEEEIKESLKPAALKRAQSSLIMREFINREKMELTEDEVKEEIASLMRQYPDQKQQEELLKPSFIDYFQRVLLSKKAMKRLKEMMVKRNTG